ncbi:MAG: tetratricopeptide repeat protein [Vicingaceae bacterium]
MKKVIFILLLIGAANNFVLAQKTTIYTHQNVTYNNALELYDKEKFSAAQEQFRLVLEQVIDKKSEITVNAQYYHAICGLELFNIDAENLLIEFIYAYPESPKVKLAYYHLGRFKFRKKKYDEAIKWFKKLDVYDLSNDELSEYHFKIGYSYFQEDKLIKASSSFYEIKDADTKFTPPAKYYYAHIAYLQKKYESALQTFLTLSDDEKFAPIVPYYITQIYFLQNKYDKVIEYAPALLENAIPKRAPEISRLLGEAYYNTQKYNEAIPYLKRYQKEKAYEATRADKYQLGYAYYKVDSCSLAIDWFKKAIDKNDSLSQAAHYNLAECYLKTGQKKYAQTSFRVASDIDFDPQIKEDALFSFAKISYELSLHPYNDAIVAFEGFINTYPNSTKLSNAYEFLIAVYYTTKNYKAALTSLENIKNLDLQLQEAYQKIAYYRGIELFNNRMYPDAINHFNKSDQYLINKKTKADNSYWRAESHYRLNKYEAAIGEFKKYIFEPEAIAANDVNKAHYGIAYSYFKLKEYENANQWFRKYAQNAKETNTKTKNDALNRIGDCFFIEKNYKAAIEYYDKATMLGLDKVDYSLYQSSITNGVIGNYKDKENLLKTLIARDKKSHLLDDAILQLGKTQEILNQPEEALANFQLLIKEHPNSPYLKQALIKEGLIFYNKKEDEKALIAFKHVVNDYPKTNEAKEAIKQIKKIHLDKGELAAYESYLASIGGADSSAQVMDADYYEVAENKYMAGSCEEAVAEFANYLEKYPNGTFTINAHFYKADCELKSGFENEALLDFNYVLKQAKNKFTETALVNAAKINANLGNTQDALNNYNQLEYLADVPANVFKAQVAQMRLNYKLNNTDEAIKYCELIINKDADDANLITEAHLIYGKMAMAKDDYNLALTEFATASSSSNKFGAEGKYHVAEIIYMRSEFDNCESEIFSMIKKFPSYGYWIGKSLILLADNYVAKEDLFQAKVTLQNIIDNSKFPELVTIAQEKLEKIEAQEAAMRVVEEEVEIDVELFDDAEFQKLFSEEEEIEDEALPTIQKTEPLEETEPIVDPIIEKEETPENENQLEETPKDE